MTAYSNISASLKKSQEKFPHKRAVVYPAGRDSKGRVMYTHLTFTQLENASDRLAFGLENEGITRGVRTILMIPPGIEFFITIFAIDDSTILCIFELFPTLTIEV